MQPTAHSIISWRAVLAGLLVAFAVNMILMALGAGIGGSAAIGMARDGDANGLATGAGIWIALSALVALVTGGYFATRSTTYVTKFGASAHGFLVAGLFFAIAMYGAGQMVGAAGSGIAQLTRVTAGGAASLADNPMVQSTIQRAIGNTQLKSDLPVVTKTTATYLLRGDEQGARSYLAYQTGLAPAELDQRLATLNAEFQAAAKTAAENTAKAIAVAGWTLFATMTLGVLAAIWGAMIGMTVNIKAPHASEAEVRAASARTLRPNPAL